MLELSPYLNVLAVESVNTLNRDCFYLASVSPHKLHGITLCQFSTKVFRNKHIVSVGVGLSVRAYNGFGRNGNINLALATLDKGTIRTIIKKAGCGVNCRIARRAIIERAIEFHNYQYIEPSVIEDISNISSASKPFSAHKALIRFFKPSMLNDCEDLP